MMKYIKWKENLKLILKEIGKTAAWSFGIGYAALTLIDVYFYFAEKKKK